MSQAHQGWLSVGPESRSRCLVSAILVTGTTIVWYYQPHLAVSFGSITLGLIDINLISIFLVADTVEHAPSMLEDETDEDLLFT